MKGSIHDATNITGTMSCKFLIFVKIIFCKLNCKLNIPHYQIMIIIISILFYVLTVVYCKYFKRMTYKAYFPFLSFSADALAQMIGSWTLTIQELTHALKIVSQL